MRRAGFIFSLDALLAAIILVGGIVLLSSISQDQSDTAQISAASEDTIVALNAVQLHDISDAWVTTQMANGSISDPNATALEQIGQYWATGHTIEAQQLAALLLNSTYPDYGLRLTMDGTTVYERNSTKGSHDVLVATQMISGIAEGKAITGSSASAYLRRIKDKRSSLFLPFGGFVGEGNISIQSDDLPSDANVTDILIELEAERPFKFIINGAQCDQLTPTLTPLVPSAWNRTNCTSLVLPGVNNTFSLNFTGTANGSYAAGGFVKIVYLTDQLNQWTNTNEVYRFPEIHGLVNLYDGMYVPGNLSSLNISLHFLSNYTSYLTIANATFTFAGSNQTRTVLLNSTNVSAALATAGLSYAALSRTTIPLRFGIGSVIIQGSPADVVIVSDTSGSMTWCTNQTEAQCFTACNCGPCASGGGTCGSLSCGIFSTCAPGDSKKINASKNATLSLVSYLLTSSGMRVGLAEFGTSVKSWHNLTSNQSALATQINAYTSTGGTCICCGINNATGNLNLEGQVVLIPRSSAGWKYNDTNVLNLGGGWNTTTYDDSDWKSATTPTGWGYAGLGTTIAAANRYQGTYYHRRLFNVTSAAAILDSKLYVYSDDGADVYLNGVRISTDYGDVQNAVYWNDDAIAVDKSLFVTGQNVIGVRQYHRKTSSNPMGFNLELIANTRGNATSTQTKNIVVMTDGQASGECSEQNTGSATQDAIQAACDAYNTYGIVTYTVGFGRDADNVTLQAMAACAGGQYFPASNATALQNAFSSIASTIIQNSNTQTAILSGNVTPTVLYGDSVITADYVADVLPAQPNEISVTLATAPFNGCTANVTLYPGMRFLDATIQSYSSDYWTNLVRVNNVNVYNLSQYASVYASMGDPYQISIPPALLAAGNNTLDVHIGVDALNASQNCSLNNTLVYTAAINLSTERSEVVPDASGCRWTVMFEDNSTINLTIPHSYSGNVTCTYLPGNISYDPDDAYQLGAYMIFTRLDFRQDGHVFVNLLEEDLEVIVTTISKVPYLWGPTLARLEVTR